MPVWGMVLRLCLLPQGFFGDLIERKSVFPSLAPLSSHPPHPAPLSRMHWKPGRDEESSKEEALELVQMGLAKKRWGSGSRIVRKVTGRWWKGSVESDDGSSFSHGGLERERKISSRHPSLLSLYDRNFGLCLVWKLCEKINAVEGKVIQIHIKIRAYLMSSSLSQQSHVIITMAPGRLLTTLGTIRMYAYAPLLCPEHFEIRIGV